MAHELGPHELVEDRPDYLTLGLGNGVFVGTVEFGVAVQPQHNAVNVFGGRIDPIVVLAEIGHQGRGLGPEFTGDRTTSSVNTLVDGAI